MFAFNEYVKKAVFYSKEKPGLLAAVLEVLASPENLTANIAIPAVEVANNTALNTVKATLPTKITAVTSKGVPFEATVTWGSTTTPTYAPTYANTHWICFVHPHQSRDLRDDSAWINASNYGAPEQLFTGEIGRIDDTRFIETTLMCNGACAATDPAFVAELKAGADGAPSDTNVYQAVIFGDAYFGIAFSLPVELRDNGVEDFGRKRSLAWYAIFGVGRLHDEYGVVIETA